MTTPDPRPDLPTDAVEAAARALFERLEDYVAGAWDDVTPGGQAVLRAEARAALDAALPHLRAQWLTPQLAETVVQAVNRCDDADAILEERIARLEREKDEDGRTLVQLIQSRDFYRRKVWRLEHQRDGILTEAENRQRDGEGDRAWFTPDEIIAALRREQP
jgi:hypothetical protein